MGSCSVIENDCVHRLQYSPWVAAVFVKPEMRRRGIASAMLQEAATIAGVLETKRRVLETVEIEARVAALEQAWPGSRR